MRRDPGGFYCPAWKVRINPYLGAGYSFLPVSPDPPGVKQAPNHPRVENGRSLESRVRNERRMLGSGRGYGRPGVERSYGARSLLYSFPIKAILDCTFVDTMLDCQPPVYCCHQIQKEANHEGKESIRKECI